VLASCDLPDFGENRAVMHAQPINFTLDDRAWMTDPRGHVGQNLSADLHILTVEERAIQSLNHCVKRCDVELAGVASSAYVSAHAALVEDEQELGAACIDMGGGATGISVFFKTSPWVCKYQLLLLSGSKRSTAVRWPWRWMIGK
jgi:cell division protein FtsA